MSASNNRIKAYCTYHHLMSRIAHRVYFMTDEVRNDFRGMIFRAAEFCGIKLVAWCIMANHFHILAYLPEPEEIGEDEILRRYGLLKGKERLSALMYRISSIRSSQGNCENRVRELLDQIKSNMYNIGVFMKITKQWLTQEYNRRYAHMGTLWEGVYKDVPVKGTVTELAKRAGYIHLNPIRAAIADEFAKYPWSSFTALCRGDKYALAGMRLIYGEEATLSEIAESHRGMMAELLEQIKFEKAIDIVRKRNAGFNPPPDPLTDEALLEQAANHLERVMRESVEEKTIAHAVGRPKGGDANVEKQIDNLLKIDPDMSKVAIAKAVGIGRTSVYAYLKRMKKCSENCENKVRP